MLASSGAAADPTAGSGEVRFEGDLVTVSALATPVGEILRSIGQRARFTVSERCGPAGCAVVSGRRRDTLAAIMAWVLSRQNHLILYDEDTPADASAGVARIVLLPPGAGVAVSDVREEVAPPQVASRASAEERRVLRRLRAARLRPRSAPRDAVPQPRDSAGIAMRRDEPLAHSARQNVDHSSSIYRISSGFGWRRDPLDGQVQHHDGVDLMVLAGTPLKSPLSGTVVFAGWAGRYGNMVEIDHGGELHTRYAHLSQISVEVGERVHPGHAIGRAGETGRSTGPHLHFEVRVRGAPQDPQSVAGVWPDLETAVTGRLETGG